MKSRKPKRQSTVSFSLSDDAITLLNKLTIKTGLSRSGVIAQAIRDLARWESDFTDSDLLKEVREQAHEKKETSRQNGENRRSRASRK